MGRSLAYKGQSLIHMGYGAYGYYIVRKNENHVSLSIEQSGTVPNIIGTVPKP